MWFINDLSWWFEFNLDLWFVNWLILDLRFFEFDKSWLNLIVFLFHCFLLIAIIWFLKWFGFWFLIEVCFDFWIWLFIDFFSFILDYWFVELLIVLVWFLKFEMICNQCINENNENTFDHKSNSKQTSIKTRINKNQTTINNSKQNNKKNQWKRKTK